MRLWGGFARILKTLGEDLQGFARIQGFARLWERIHKDSLASAMIRETLREYLQGFARIHENLGEILQGLERLWERIRETLGEDS